VLLQPESEFHKIKNENLIATVKYKWLRATKQVIRFPSSDLNCGRLFFRLIPHWSNGFQWIYYIYREVAVSLQIRYCKIKMQKVQLVKLSLGGFYHSCWYIRSKEYKQDAYILANGRFLSLRLFLIHLTPSKKCIYISIEAKLQICLPFANAFSVMKRTFSK